MGFNYGYEKKKFDSRWKRLEVEYCDAGVDCQVKLTHFFVEFCPTLVTDKAEY